MKTQKNDAFDQIKPKVGTGEGVAVRKAVENDLAKDSK